MSLHDFDSRAGLDSTMVLHFGHDSDSFSSSSPATALEGYIVVPDRLPLAAKSHNVQSRPISRSGHKPAKPGSDVVRDISLAVSSSRPCTPRKQSAESDAPLTISLSRPCTPFQPLPPVLATSPLRLSSFLDPSLRNESTAPSLAPSLESPSPQPIFRQLSIEIPSVSHPNSPYVPWASPVRRNILRPLTPSSQVSGFSGYSRPYSRSGARAPEPQEPDSPAPVPNKLLRLSKSFKNLRKAVKQSVKHVKNALRKTSKAKAPEAVDQVVAAPISRPSHIFSPPLPSPVASCDSSNTNSLAEWLRECAANVERATPHFMTLEEYEARGSWIDLTNTWDESEIQSPPASDIGGDGLSEHFPSPCPMSPTCTNSSMFPHLSMHDIWPTPPRFVPPARGFSDKREREMSMPGGWNFTLRDSPAAYE